jgi:hypothetical protein
MGEIWKCELCGQSVKVVAGKFVELPQGYFENCKLREHMIGDECIAFRDADGARRILAQKAASNL